MVKIYDGVDYPLVDYRGCDCMYLADRDCSCEAVTYQSISLCLQGSTVSRYFGSWTFSVETSVAGRHRCVHLILLEHVDGDCMLDMVLRTKGVTRTTQQAATCDTIPVNYRLLSPESERLDVLASIIEAEIALFKAGIIHQDVTPRDVLISRFSDARCPHRLQLLARVGMAAGTR